ncbi:hypothetical protein GW17_00040667 [Ensete ventricosum]|nr:hypothetical protein GW17_00040667 [Ensete ventricosum]RZS16481.1 hypothetical protein BHM03_00048477 [Ensete ventricosum]
MSSGDSVGVLSSVRENFGTSFCSSLWYSYMYLSPSKTSLPHHWNSNCHLTLDILCVQYEYMMLHDLLKKGHPEPTKKIGVGIQAFQVRYHPAWKSRCFFLVRVDETVDDFSFRKCVDNILPLPENMKARLSSCGNKVMDHKKAWSNQKGGRGGRGRGGRGGGRRGRGGKGGGFRK